MNSAGRRIVWAGGGVALVILGALVWWFAGRDDNKPPTVSPAPRAAAAIGEEQPKPIGDADQDGLSNWEEALRKTDPNNPDSDGDGTSDKEELEAGRDPLKKGPDDAVQSAFALQIPPPRAEMLTPIRAPIRQEITAEPPPPRQASTAIPPVVVNPELRAFGNALGTALALITNDSFVQNEQALIAQAVPSRDGSALPALAPLAEIYERVASNLQTVAAPPEGAALLVKLKDGYARLGRAVLELSKGDGELTVISQRWMEYSDAVIAVGKALNEAIGFFWERGVVFGADDPGRIFVLSSM